MSDREELQEKLEKAKQDFAKAGIIHRRDLAKFIRRTEKELRYYDQHYVRKSESLQ